jgi:glutathione S-transferase
VITVYKFASAWGQPDLSPFVFKLETYLRMAGIEYKGVPGDPRKSPKKKLPYIEHDGRTLGDSAFIIEHLKSSFGDTLDAALTPRERALATAVQAMLEEQLYFVILYQRWQDDRGWEAYSPALRDYLASAGIPRPLRGLVLAAARRATLKALHGQGTGRHTPAEVDAIGKRIITAVADSMGDGPFFLGPQPASIDATVYPFLTGIMETPVPSNVKTHAESLPALRAYADRMKARYWSQAR